MLNSTINYIIWLHFRLSCVLHVLLTVVSHFIDNDKVESDLEIEREIPVRILEITEQIIKYFADQRKAFMMVSMSKFANCM